MQGLGPLIQAEDKILPCLEGAVDLYTGDYSFERDSHAKRKLFRLRDKYWDDLDDLGVTTNRFKGINDPIVVEEHLTDYAALSRTTDAYVVDSVVEGQNALSPSQHPMIENSFIYGHYALTGSPYIEASPAKRAFIAQHEDKILSGEYQAMYEAIKLYQYRFSPSTERATARLPERMEDALPDAADNEVRNAACQLYETIRRLTTFGDTYDVSITNSIIAGRNVLSHVKGGRIEESFIAGSRPLNGAHAIIRNSYVTNQEGTTYIDTAVFGEPEQYTTVPNFLNDTDPLPG